MQCYNSIIVRSNRSMHEPTFTCFHCDLKQKEFTVLICGHVFCADCFEKQSTRSLTFDMVVCKCGIKTCFGYANVPAQENIRPRPRMTSSKDDLQRYLSSQSNSALKTFNQNSMQSTQPLRRMVTQDNQTQNQRREVRSDYLTNELIFMKSKYKHDVEAVQGLYQRKLNKIHRAYIKIEEQMKKSCLAQQAEPEICQKHWQSKVVQVEMKKYEERVGKRLKSILGSLEMNQQSRSKSKHPLRDSRLAKQKLPDPIKKLTEANMSRFSMYPHQLKKKTKKLL